MNTKISALLAGRKMPCVFPFLWLHGESQEKLLEYVNVIYDANIRAVCLESRPHPDFGKEGWWRDLDFLLAEFRKRDMKVWILDDSHFPTGYANGALQDADPKLCRSFLARAILDGDEIPEKAPAWKPGRYEQGMTPARVFDDDRIVSVTKRPDGKTAVCYVTRNRGPHRNYMNMMDMDSCRVLIDEVYEPHYAHYAADFGEMILGFFSDEPELGNDHLYEYCKRLWEQDDLAWSDRVESELREKWGADFAENLPLLWEPEGRKAAIARYDYMDAVTRAVKECFSDQIGGWCRAHGVEYIGHLIEDNNQHTRAGSSLGHYFRGLSGQDMAGIDDIGIQVIPQGEWNGYIDAYIDYRDGEFYHYVMGKLAASHAEIDPKKKGRAMCEIFGVYGWGEGLKLEKYLIDHFLVRGVNRFVPHAYNPGPFPDPDCPPHFYANGHDPQHRHFGALMDYTNRACAVLSDGERQRSAAILYNATAEWMGGYLDLQKLAVPLYDRQIDYDIIPEDVFSDPAAYVIPPYRLLLVPGMQYIEKATLDGLRALRDDGCEVWFVGRYPEAYCDSEESPDFSSFPLVPLSELADRAEPMFEDRVKLSPENDRIRVLHYRAEDDIFFLVNEGTETWRGTLTLPAQGSVCVYNIWENVLETIPAKSCGGCTQAEAEIIPGKSLCLLFGMEGEALREPVSKSGLAKKDIGGGWIRSQCESVRYPDFENPVSVDLPDRLAEEQPKFSGLVRYEKTLHFDAVPARCVLEITDATESVELFVNGRSLGVRVPKPCVYDLAACLKPGENTIVIEAATTLERALCPGPKSLSGVHGNVYLWE